jgi:hypothetical protein
MKRFTPFVWALALGLTLAGCSGGSSGTEVSKAQEDAFRNPPKEIPPDSLKAMQKSREEGMKRAAAARAAAGGPGAGNVPGAPATGNQ